MHASLTELLENLKPGLLWVSREGVVRYANGDASVRTGLAPGRKLYDPDLSRAVAAAVAGQVPRAVKSVGSASAPGDAAPELQCRVIPGLTADDAFVLIGADPAADHGTAYDNLMQVIRSDLRDPLAGLHRALQIDGARDAVANDVLLEKLDDVTRTLDKLLDLASVWGSAALLANDRIELWNLLQQAWASVEPLAVARSVKVRFRAQAAAEQLATLYGSEAWLQRVFAECLEMAVRAAPRGATIDIEHRQMGPRAMVVFRDSGLFAPRAEGAVVLSGAKSKPPHLPGREHISLKLCQHIVALHGGQLREETEDGLRNFLIDLPTGAPHRDDQSQLDIAQAQQYARDLAALMTRARTQRRDTPPKG
jgi:hypothetical protein